MLRFDSKRLGLPHHLSGIGAVARALIEAGAPIDGDPDDRETPLITAASYGDAEVAQTLIKAGADLEAKSAPNSGGVPSGTALQHAAVFGMTDVVDVLVATGARINSLEDAAAAGDIRDWLKPDTQLEAKVRALVIAADHQRLDVIDQLAASGTPINAVDAQWGRQPLCVAAQHGRVRSVKHLLALGADTNVSDGKGRTPFEYAKGSGHSQLAEMIRAAGKKTER